MLVRSVQLAVLLVLADIALANIANGNVNNELDVQAVNKSLSVEIETRRRNRKKKKGKGHRSTSSSSGEKKGASGKSGSGESLEASSSGSSSDEFNNRKPGSKPQSSAERRGWRKWHRKCPPCPEDMAMKWRDPRINWICGAYQRARRSFKSLCMMYYRNCQDGTMFTKIHDHRCANDNNGEDPHGEHFFYEYNVKLSDETSKSGSQQTSSHESEGNTSY